MIRPPPLKYFSIGLRGIEEKHSLLRHGAAMFVTGVIWPHDTPLTIGFFRDDGEKRVRFEKSYLTDINRDPIENEIHNMKPIDAVKYVLMKRLQPYLAMPLVFVDDVQTANIRIKFDEASSGSWSIIGATARTEASDMWTMNLGWICAGTILHEFGHALGMAHEHQNLVDNPIQWDRAFIYKWSRDNMGWSREKTDINFFQVFETSQTNGSSFDIASIMLYPLPIGFAKHGLTWDTNRIFSRQDVLWITKYYNPKMSLIELDTIYRDMFGKHPLFNPVINDVRIQSAPGITATPSTMDMPRMTVGPTGVVWRRETVRSRRSPTMYAFAIIIIIAMIVDLYRDKIFH